MKSIASLRRFRLVAAGLAAASLGAGAFGPAAPAQAATCPNADIQIPSAPSNPGNDTIDEARAAIVCLVNQKRTSTTPFSVVPLTTNAALGKLAQSEAPNYAASGALKATVDMSTYCKGTSCVYAHFGYRMKNATPRKIVDGAMASSLKSELMSAKYRDIGVGAGQDLNGEWPSMMVGITFLLGKTG